jgi:DTW domain-containing protein YfiP
MNDQRSPPPTDAAGPRAMCYRCMRPASVCYCSVTPAIQAATPVLFLQHPREEFVAIGTARMASLCLSRSTLVVGTHIDDHPTVRAVLDDPARTAILLWPGPGARDLSTDPPSGPSTLVVVDGTWPLAKKLVRLNPRVAALPRYGLTPARASEYRIRKEPAEACVSTLEAVLEALSLLEGDRAAFEPMMTPFRAMIDAQIAHALEAAGTGQSRRRRNPRPPRPRPVPALLREHRSVVVVCGEANAWPRRGPAPHPPDELVQWLAVRLDDAGNPTDARFEEIIRPRQPLSEATPFHTRLGAEELRAGSTFAEFHERWRDFVRDDDVVVFWGTYAAILLEKEGGFVPESSVDLRLAMTHFLGDTPGTLSDLTTRLGLDSAPLGKGRGGARLGGAAAVAAFLMRLSAPPPH